MDTAITNTASARSGDCLNPQQQHAISHIHGPLLILAGAGVGKTTTLVHGLKELICRGVPPNRILLLTFTRAAARQMVQKAEEALARQGAGTTTSGLVQQVWSGTFHAVAHRLLRMYGNWIGLNSEFTILDRSDSEDLMKVVQAELNLGSDQAFPKPSTAQSVYSTCVNCQQPLEQVLVTTYPTLFDHLEDLRRLFQTYTDRKQQQNVVDFDDLLVLLHGLLSDGSAGGAVRALFDCVLVDEYQDTNRLQSEIVRLLRPDGSGVAVVGDDAQAIYSFRGATVRNILDFPQQFPNTQIVKLEQNYRSTQEILQLANAVIAQQSEGYAKQLWSDRTSNEWPFLVTCSNKFTEAQFVAESVLNHRETGLDFQQQAVLFRASHHSIPLEAELARRGIPFLKRGGITFMQAGHVKDVLAYLRLAENPRDLLAGTRVLCLLPGIGPKKSHELLDSLSAANGDFGSWWNLTSSRSALPQWRPLITLMSNLACAQPPELSGQIGQIIAFYEPLLRRNWDKPDERMLDLRQVEVLATQYSSRTSFLSDLTLDPLTGSQGFAKDSVDDDQDRLVLSTIHSAKGLEWDAVYVIHASDGNIPSSRSVSTCRELDEERRLFFVALTRAKDHLYVTFPLQNAGPQGNGKLAKLTRFLPQALWPFMHQIGFGHPPTLDGSPVVQSNAEVKRLRDNLRKFWDSAST